ncbi:MAG: winged helix-turn-helix domain-containing protein [Bryobacterales bacterium]
MFTFDAGSGRLEREGQTIALGVEATTALEVLTAERGDLVTRRELRRAIWGSAAPASLDEKLDECVAQLREALSDVGEPPFYVLEVPGKGFRFIAPVENVVRSTPATRPVGPRRRMLYVGVVAVAAVLVAGFFSPSAVRPLVTVTHFDNETGDPTFDSLADDVTDALMHDLSHQKGLKVADAARNPDYMIVGEIQNDGTAVRVLADLIRLPAQTHVKTVRFELAPELDRPTESWLAEEIARDFGPRIAAHETGGI